MDKKQLEFDIPLYSNMITTSRYTKDILAKNSELNGFWRYAEATRKQKEFAGKLGLDIEGLPLNVARSMVECLVSVVFDGRKIIPATKKQIEFGMKYGWDFSNVPRDIAFPYIGNILWELNFTIIKQQQLEPGVWTVNIHSGEIRQISSIDENGFVSFIDTNTHSYARSLLRCSAPPDNKPRAPGSLVNMTHEQLNAKLLKCIFRETGVA